MSSAEYCDSFKSAVKEFTRNKAPLRKCLKFSFMFLEHPRERGRKKKIQSWKDPFRDACFRYVFGFETVPIAMFIRANVVPEIWDISRLMDHTSKPSLAATEQRRRKQRMFGSTL